MLQENIDDVSEYIRLRSWVLCSE